MLLLGIYLTAVLQSYTTDGATNTRNYTVYLRGGYKINIPGTTRDCCNGEYITNIRCNTPNPNCRLTIRFTGFDIPPWSNVTLYDGNRYVGKAEFSYGEWRFLPKITHSPATIYFTTGNPQGKKYSTYQGINVRVKAIKKQFADMVRYRWRIEGYLPEEDRGYHSWELPTVKPDPGISRERSGHIAWLAVLGIFFMAVLVAINQYKKEKTEENTEESSPRQARAQLENRLTSSSRLTATTNTNRIRSGPLPTTRTERPRPADRPRPTTSSSASRTRPRSFMLTRPGSNVLPPSSTSSSSSNITHISTDQSNHRNPTQDSAIVEPVIEESHRPTPSPPPYDEALSPSYDPCHTEAPPPPYEDVAANNPPHYSYSYPS